MVDQCGGHLDLALRQAPSPGDLADLGDHDPAAVAGRHRHRQHLALDRLALHREVAVLVRGGAADDGHVDRKGVEQQPLPSPQRDDLDHVLGGPRVLPAPGLARIYVRAEPNVSDQPRAAGGDLAHQLGEHTLWEGVGLDLVGLDQRAQARFVADVAADGPALEPRQPELTEPAVGEVADADNPHGGQVPGVAGLFVHRRQLVDEPLREGMAGAGPADDDGRAVADEADRVADRDDLANGGSAHGM